MDSKAQIVGEVIKQLRPPDTLATPEEARGQFQRMVELLDEPPPASVQVSDLTCPGPAGPIPLRLYAPQGTGARSLLLYIHGGGWMQGGLETHHGACGKLAAWSRLPGSCRRLSSGAPEQKFPAGLEDCLAAWRWLVTNTATLGADPERLAIGGDSAGRQSRRRGLPGAGFQRRARAGGPAPGLSLARPGRGLALAPRAGGRLTSCPASGSSGSSTSTCPRRSRRPMLQASPLRTNDLQAASHPRWSSPPA